jgi:SAM-dependent methyltransferase
MKYAKSDSDFDAYAEHYGAALDRGISLSGEDKHFFARERVRWTKRCLGGSFRADEILDFGCGTGAATPFLLESFGPERLTGVDISAQCLDTARKENAHARARYLRVDDYRDAGAADLTFTNGVFHHIPAEDRDGAMGFVFRALRPGGFFALWENNMLNPGTCLVMSRIPFDRDAIMLLASDAKRLLRKAGFEVLRIDYLFIFPRALKGLRVLERALTRLPLGAQYQVLARKPGTSA